MVKEMLTKNIKQKLFFGFLCIFMGLGFALYYEFIDLESVYGLGSIALGFSVGSFVILMGIIEDIYFGDKNGKQGSFEVKGKLQEIETQEC